MQPAQPAPDSPEQSSPLAERLVQKDELIEMLAHDLNSPLTTIIMAAETVRADFSGKDAGLDSLIREIQAASDRMRRLISKALTVKNLQNKEQFLELTSMPLLPAVSAVVRRHEPVSSGKEIKILLSSSAKNDWIRADYDALDQILDLLVTNSMKCTPEGGVISLSVVNELETVAVSVSDTGPALSPEQLRTMFDKSVHQTTKRAPGERPSGIALFAVKELTEMMGGRLEVRPSEGAGATFVLRFPMANDE